jgi:AcrR family transcriptional regulator
MLGAMAEAVAEKGYARTTVADVIKRAGVSRETFYEQFRDKEECFLAAIDELSAELAAQIGGSLSDTQDAGRMERLDRALEAYLETLAAEPATARALLVEIYAAGPEAQRKRVEMLDRFVELVAAIIGARTKRERFDAEALVASLSSFATMRAASGELDSLPALRRPMMDVARRVLGEAA